MNLAEGIIAILALTGWMLTNLLHSVTNVNNANALNLQVKVSRYIDETLNAAVARLRQSKLKPSTPEEVQRRAQTVLNDETEAVREAMRMAVNRATGQADETAGDSSTMTEMPIEE